MNCKAKGNKNERRTRDWYLKQKTSKWDYTNRNDTEYGYGDETATAVIKAGGSLGKFDLIVIFPHHHDYIQVKTNRWPGPKERAGMIADMDKYPADVRFVCFRWDDKRKDPKIRFL